MKSKQIKTLLLSPRLSEPGGVANYYSVIRDYLSSDIEYFFVGNDADNTTFRKVLRMLCDYLAFFKIILMYRPKLIHLNPSLGIKSAPREAVFSLMAKFLRIKRIVFFRGWDLTVENMISDNKIFRYLFAWSFFGSDIIVVLASDFKTTLRNWGYSGRIIVESTVVSDTYLKHELPNSEERSTKLLFLSRIEKEKGLFEVIDAYVIQKAINPCIELSIAGDGPDLLEVQEYIKAGNIKDVNFLGYVRGKEKKNVYLDHGIFMLPTSYGEGMPNALLEAMAFGMAIVTSPVGGIADMFENEKMGLLVSDPDADKVNLALSKLINQADKILEIGQYNRTYIEKNCVASVVAKRLENMYEMVLTPKY